MLNEEIWLKGIKQICPTMAVARNRRSQQYELVRSTKEVRLFRDLWESAAKNPNSDCWHLHEIQTRYADRFFRRLAQRLQRLERFLI